MATTERTFYCEASITRLKILHDDYLIREAGIDIYEDNQFYYNMMATIPDSLFDLAETSVINRMVKAISDVYYDTSTWVYFSHMNAFIQTAKYNRLDKNFGELFNLPRLDGYYEDEAGALQYDSLMDETYDYNPWPTEYTESFYLLEGGYQLDYKNIKVGSEKITKKGEELWYFRDVDYTIDYVDGQIYRTENSRINDSTKIQAIYSPELAHVYENIPFSEIVIAGESGEWVDLSHKIIETGSVIVFSND